VIAGLQLPHLSTHDPELFGEGTLDPLGLASLSNRLAEEIVPWVTARMYRIRFITAIAVASRVVEPMIDRIAVDGVTSPSLAFEWLVLEALARGHLPEDATFRVPGIEKARAVRIRNGHLDGMSYLKVPKVFGFHGVYKRLAIGMRVVDDNLDLMERGDRLVRTWEREQAMAGFADGLRRTDGGSFLRTLQTEVSRALQMGKVATSSVAHVWSKLVKTLRPDSPGTRERRLLHRWLTDREEPIRRELVLGLENQNSEGEEWEALRFLRKSASAELSLRLKAINQYELFSELLQTAFDLLRRVSTAAGTQPVSHEQLTSNELLTDISLRLPKVTEEAVEALEVLALGSDFEKAFGRFNSVYSTAQLVDELLDHHCQVQAEKLPAGKRPWFEITPEGFIARIQFRLDTIPSLSGSYLHPYRVQSVRRFLEDLR